jgi:hypothetical protein
MKNNQNKHIKLKINKWIIINIIRDYYIATKMYINDKISFLNLNIETH